MEATFNMREALTEAIENRGLSKEALTEEEFDIILNELLEIRIRQETARKELEMNFRFIDNEE